MLFENVKTEIAKSKGVRGGDDYMSLLLIRPFEVVYKGNQYKVVMVRADNVGNRFYAIPSDEITDPPEALKWIAERWIEKIIPLDPA